jgi:hypothetical protein
MKIRLNNKHAFYPFEYLTEEGLGFLLTKKMLVKYYFARLYCDVFGGDVSLEVRLKIDGCFEETSGGPVGKLSQVMKLFDAYTGPNRLPDDVEKPEDVEKKRLLETLGEYYDQFEAIGCKTPEEAVRIGLDAYFGKLREPLVPPVPKESDVEVGLWLAGKDVTKNYWNTKELLRVRKNRIWENPKMSIDYDRFVVEERNK